MNRQQEDRRLVVASLALTLGALLGLGMLIGLPGQAVAAPQRMASPLDVVINEVAWMGTSSTTTSDEWIELYNNTSAAIDLTGWTLASTTDGNPSITLNGTIPAHGYFLLERGDDNTVSNIAADQIYNGTLSNSGEVLELRDDTNALIDSANGDGGGWPAGTASPDYTSMERIDSTAADTAANWDTNDGITRNGLDANGLPINGTPKARNSVTPVPEADLAAHKAGPDSVLPGQTITYTVAFSNVGTLDAAGVVVTDVLPAFVTYQSDTSSYPVAEPTPGTWVWTVGPVGIASGTLSFQVVGLVSSSATGELTNVVTVTTTTTETVTNNNHDTWATTAGVSGTANVLITALHPHGYQGYDDEAVQIRNLGTATADLDGWYLADDPTDTSGTKFPAGVTLAPGVSIWCARSAVAFAEEFGFKPDYETDDTDLTVPELINDWPNFTNTGDECALFDGSTKLMDVLVYGTSTSQTGWSGAAIQPWTPSTAFAESGQILYRKLDQPTGHSAADTNTAADWAQDPNDHIDGRKVQYPGWDLGEFFQTAKVTETANLVVAVAPDNAYEIIKGYVDNATTSILIEGYTFENAHLIDAVVGRAQAGVTVKLLLEGGKVTDQERWFCQRLNAAGGEAYFMHNDDPADIHDRYTNQHAKFMIIDNQILVVGSENFNYSGLPVDDKTNGTWGRRGAFLITDAPGVVARAQAIFNRDLDTAHKDIVAWSPAHPRYGTPTPGFTPTYVYSDWVTYTVRFSQPLTLHDTFAFEVVQSPENSLRDADSLLGLVARAGAGDTVLVELLYEREHWGPTASTPATDPNPRLEAYIDAARRGSTVRILLNGSLDTGSVSENALARDYVNGIARSEDLDLEACLGDPAGRGIHNKMVLIQIDGEGFIHVGSINGSEISSKGNRELALQVQSNDAYDYLVRVFEFDWWQAHPIHLPLVLRDYTPPPPPVDYVVLSEIYYAGSVSAEWVEIYNPTEQAVDLSDFKIGDAEKAARYEGMYRFPPGTTIAPQGVLVVAFDGSQVPQADFELSDKSDTPDMIKHAAWGTGDWTLRNDGDQVLLLGPINQVVDVVLWGDETYSGVTPHPGVSVFTHSLERYPPYYDTDDCAVDFRDLFPPDPGRVSLP
jgi:uncharacterized repeat protein (TIGR01451 family)